MTLCCSLLLLATHFGLAHPEQSSHRTQADALHAVPLMQESLCEEGSGHGTCQLVIADQPLLFGQTAISGSSQFKITPVLAQSRSFAPHTPPPRHVF